MKFFYIAALVLLASLSTAQDSDQITADTIDEIVAEQMLEIDKATIEIDGEVFIPEEVIPDFENERLVLLYNEGNNAILIPVDVANQDVSPQGDITLLERMDGSYSPLYVLSDYSVSEDGDSLFVSGEASAEDAASVSVRFAYSEALMGAGSTDLRVANNEAFFGGTLGTRSYAQIKDLVAEHPEVDTLVLTQSEGSVNDEVNVYTGRLIRNAGLNTKVLADSDINSGMVDVFAAGAQRIYTEGAILGVHSWCCVGDLTAGELPQDHPAHAAQLAYFTEMLGEELGPDFYFYTLQAAPFDGIHPMSTQDVERFKLATEILTSESPEMTLLASETLEPIPCADLITVPDIATEFFTDDTQCAYVIVPENHNDPEGPTIKLATYFLPSTSSTPAPDSVLYLEGGPGGAAVLSLPDFATGNASFLRERGDVILLDQRGTGYSKPSLLCSEFTLMEDELEAAATCQERLIAEGINLKHYNSQQNALDVGAVREAYGYDEVSLYGISYGTRLALTAMRDAPEGIRSVVLDSVFPPQINGMSEDVEVIYYVLDKIVATCVADEGCAAQYPDLSADLEKGVLRLQDAPLGELTAVAYIQQLRGSFTSARTPELISTVASGTESDIETLLTEMATDEEEMLDMVEIIQSFPEDMLPVLLPILIGESQGMGYSVVCAEEHPFLDVTALPEGSENWLSIRDTVTSAAEPGFTPEVCTVWDVPASDVLETLAVESDIPTLVLAGEGDVATPPAWSELAANTLAQGQYVEFPVLGHGLLGDDCVNEVVTQFLGQLDASVDSSCTASMPTLQYGAE